MELVWPSREYLPGYIDALKRGWSQDNLRGQEASDEERRADEYVGAGRRVVAILLFAGALLWLKIDASRDLRRK